MAGLVFCCFSEQASTELNELQRKWELEETWTILCNGNVSETRGNLTENSTFSLDEDVDGIPFVHFCRVIGSETFLVHCADGSGVLAVFLEEAAWESKLAADHGTPLPYVLGFHEFCGHKFIVNEDVMIPKRGTETLVESAPPYGLDLGTGSGCLLLAILARLPGSTGVGIDLSEPALAVARRNASALLQNHPSRAVFGRAAFLHVADFLAAPDSPVASAPFDIVVANPPYLARALWDSARLYAQQRREPRDAVVAGETGAECYREIRDGLRAAAAFVRLDAWLRLEVNGEPLVDPVKVIFAESACGWRFVEARCNGNGVVRCVEFEFGDK
ncbi:hypothetical protein HDU83_007958 [Entophlyctis luteolus]|nr:hypothetical protein HDU83_007958 [Entophlyctis luteolus]